MIRKADTLGTFQVESRAQMAMLLRMKPTTFYDSWSRSPSFAPTQSRVAKRPDYW